MKGKDEEAGKISGRKEGRRKDDIGEKEREGRLLEEQEEKEN